MMLTKSNRKTNYRNRLKLLKSGKPRLVIRKTNSQIIAQVTEYGEKGDKTVASAHGNDLKKFGWSLSCKNTPAAYLVGFLLGKRSDSKEAIVDKGNSTLKKDSYIYYVMKGAKDAGMDVHSDKIPVSEGRLYGDHISGYFEARKGNQFSSVGDKVRNIKKEVEETVAKINQHGRE